MEIPEDKRTRIAKDADSASAQKQSPPLEENFSAPTDSAISEALDPAAYMPGRKSAMKELVATRNPKGGRPSKFTPERRKLILDSIGAGAPIGVAITAAGIGRHTYYDWMARGREAAVREEEGFEVDDTEAEYMEFALGVVQAEAMGELRLLTHISKAAASDWRAAKELLKLRWPQRWREVSTTEIITDGNPGLAPGGNADDNAIEALARELTIRAAAKERREIVDAEVVEDED